MLGDFRQITAYTLRDWKISTDLQQLWGVSLQIDQSLVTCVKVEYSASTPFRRPRLFVYWNKSINLDRYRALSSEDIIRVMSGRTLRGRSRNMWITRLLWFSPIGLRNHQIQSVPTCAWTLLALCYQGPTMSVSDTVAYTKDHCPLQNPALRLSLEHSLRSRSP